MTGRHLLLISIGPVQDFIAQARRTRDLWFGSHLLSELSRACAAQLTRDDATLIFPALDKDDPELQECDEPTRGEHGEPPLSIANKILAVLPAGTGPAARAKAAREAGFCRWRGIARKVRNGRRHVLAKNIDAVWSEQIDDILEFYAVWVPLGEDYKLARDAVEQALAGRKSLRDFRPWKAHRDRAPKSSLDGARVSVLPEQEDREHADFHRFGIRAGEQLDAVGLVKRTGFDPDRFIPLVNVAAGHWLQCAKQTAPDELKTAGAASKMRAISEVRRNLKVIEPFSFDASALYPSRWPTLFREFPEFSEAPAAEAAKAARLWGDMHIRPLLNKMESEPPSYVACLVADGDHMGRAIDTLKDSEENRTFSRKLGAFPRKAREIVEDKYFGSLVFAGGDDVLAFLPVATAAACAQALAKAFHAALAGTVSEDDTPTLSVGIGIGHVLDPMASLLQLGRDAERAAKESGRNALAVIVDKRSGGQRRFTLRWKHDPLQRLRDDVTLLAGGSLPTGKAHALEDLLNRFPEPDARGLDLAAAAPAFVAYANDLLRHTGEGDGTVNLHGLGVPKDLADYAKLRAAVRTAIDRVLAVRTMMEAGFDGKTN